MGKSNGWNKFLLYKRVPFVVKKFGRFVLDCDISFNHRIFSELQVKQRKKVGVFSQITFIYEKFRN